MVQVAVKTTQKIVRKSLDESILKAISSGKKALLIELIHPLTRNRIKLDWLKYAAEVDQFDCFRILIEKKETVRLEVFSPYMLYGQTLRKSDTRYLASLLQHGAYESVVQNLDVNSKLGLRIFLKASAQSLRYLQENNYTFGICQGVELIIHSNSNRKASQLASVKDSLFASLNVVSLARVLEYFIEEGSQERVGKILATVDATTMLSKVCESGDIQTLNCLIKAGIELVPVTSVSSDNYAVSCRQHLRQIRQKLIELTQLVASS